MVHGKGTGKEKMADDKAPGVLVPADTIIHTREEGPTVQLRGVAGKWINGQYSMVLKYRGKLDKSPKTLYTLWKRKIANPISKIDDDVKHIFREHNREAHHWRNWGAKGHRKIVVDSSSSTGTWKAVKGFWDGSSKNNGRSGCGVVTACPSIGGAQLQNQWEGNIFHDKP